MLHGCTASAPPQSRHAPGLLSGHERIAICFHLWPLPLPPAHPLPLPPPPPPPTRPAAARAAMAGSGNMAPHGPSGMLYDVEIGSGGAENDGLLSPTSQQLTPRSRAMRRSNSTHEVRRCMPGVPVGRSRRGGCTRAVPYALLQAAQSIFGSYVSRRFMSGWCVRTAVGARGAASRASTACLPPRGPSPATTTCRCCPVQCRAAADCAHRVGALVVPRVLRRLLLPALRLSVWVPRSAPGGGGGGVGGGAHLRAQTTARAGGARTGRGGQAPRHDATAAQCLAWASSPPCCLSSAWACSRPPGWAA